MDAHGVMMQVTYINARWHRIEITSEEAVELIRQLLRKLADQPPSTASSSPANEATPSTART